MAGENPSDYSTGQRARRSEEAGWDCSDFVKYLHCKYLEVFSMKTRIVRIGISQGIRIPKAFLEETGLSGEVDISVQDGSLIIKRAHKPRAGWGTAFQKMAERGDDALLDEGAPTLTRWDEDEWEWR
jgi:antitoxin MazE